MPLIVLTQGRPIQDAQSVEAAVRTGWVGLQRQLAERSRRGRQVLVLESDHGIPEEAPDAVISAVQEIVTTVRRDGRSPPRRRASISVRAQGLDGIEPDRREQFVVELRPSEV